MSYGNEYGFEVLFEDNHLLFVNKPAGLLSQGDSTRDDSLIDIAKYYIKHEYNKPGNVYLGLPHRLDRPVSGVIMLCKTSKSLTRINEMIKKREIQKFYYAIVPEIPEERNQKLSAFIKKDKLKNKAIISENVFDGAKSALLNYKFISANKKGQALLQVQLLTGRPHQIRAQLAFVGLPIVGDLKYKHQKPLADKSIALHARTLKLIHPVTKAWLEVKAPLPKKDWWRGFKIPKK